MRSISLWIPFTLAICFAFLGTAFFPGIRIWVFSPFLAILYHRVSFAGSLWISFFCGLLLDCISSQFRFGLFALSHVLASFFLYSQKKHFFEDKWVALSLYSWLISFFLSSFLMLFACMGSSLKGSLQLIVSDLFFMPLLEGIYAFLWFTCPLSLIVYFKRHGFRKLFSPKDNSA